MEKPWFDRETDMLLLDEYVVGMDSYRRIMEDNEITDEEVVKQTQNVISLLHQLEEALSPKVKTIATEALCELTVLNALQVKRLQLTTTVPKEIGL